MENLQSSTLLIQSKPKSIMVKTMNGHSNGFGPCDILDATFSNTNKMFMSEVTTNHQQCTVGFENLTYTVSDSLSSNKFGPLSLSLSSHNSEMKTILNGLSGEFKPGELTAIMGPSGSGKTTLMSILAGHKTNNVSGKILINGKIRDLSAFRKLCCYIMQEDILLQQLTVIEAMTFAAQLKLPLHSTKIHQLTRISQILQTIGLSHCMKTKTRDLSGGEMKRLAIALELVTNPPVMFLDEPTSGLDSSSCYSCVSLLKALAHEGQRAIIATIHQPSARIFEQFDSLYLLSEGHCLYAGPTKSLVPFFSKQELNCPSNHNPADFSIEVASGEYGRHWIKALRKVSRTEHHPEESLNNGTLIINNNGTHKRRDTNVSFQTTYKSYEPGDDDDPRMAKLYNQFKVLFRRSFICITRDWMLNHLRFVSTIIVGILIGVIFKGAGQNADQALNNVGGIFFGMLFLIFTAMLTTILTFPLERQILVREHSNCWYSLKSYYMARTLADLPFQLFFPIMFISITYFWTDQPREAFRFGIVCLMAVLLSLVSQSVGMFVGSFCSVQSSVFIGPISTIPVILFSGLFNKLSTIPFFLRWVAYISYARFALQSTITALYGYDREDLYCDQPYCFFKDPKNFLKYLEPDEICVPRQIAGITLILIVLRFVTYFALKFKIMSDRT